MTPSCPPAADLSAFHDGALPPADMRAVAAHVATCPSCRAAVERHRGLGSLLRALPEETAGEAVVSRTIAAARRRRWGPTTAWTVAATLAATAVLIVAVRHREVSRPAESVALAPARSPVRPEGATGRPPAATPEAEADRAEAAEEVAAPGDFAVRRPLAGAAPLPAAEPSTLEDRAAAPSACAPSDGKPLRVGPQPPPHLVLPPDLLRPPRAAATGTAAPSQRARALRVELDVDVEGRVRIRSLTGGDRVARRELGRDLTTLPATPVRCAGVAVPARLSATFVPEGDHWRGRLEPGGGR